MRIGEDLWPGARNMAVNPRAGYNGIKGRNGRKKLRDILQDTDVVEYDRFDVNRRESVRLFVRVARGKNRT